MNKEDRDNISSLVKSVYRPSTIERQLKARFWTYWLEGPSKGTPSIDQVIEFLGEPAIERKAQNPAFTNWFLNRFEAVEKRIANNMELSETSIIETLKSKDNENNPVCRPNLRNGYGFTFASIIMILSDRPYVRLTAGPPDESEFQTFEFSEND